MFGAGFMGTLLMGCGLDSPGRGGLIAFLLMLIFIGIATIGYLLMDTEAILEEKTPFQRKEPEEVQLRKARNRNQVWNAWIATK